MSFCEFFYFIIKFKTIRTSYKSVIISIYTILIETFYMYNIYVSTKYSCLPFFPIKIPICVFYFYCKSIIRFPSCFITLFKLIIIVIPKNSITQVFVIVENIII